MTDPPVALVALPALVVKLDAFAIARRAVDVVANPGMDPRPVFPHPFRVGMMRRGVALVPVALLALPVLVVRRVTLGPRRRID